MAPSMIFTPDGKPFLAYGSPGGATIINSVVNITINLIDHRMTLQQAIDAPRVSVAGRGSSITLETRVPGGHGGRAAGPRLHGHRRRRLGAGGAVDPKTGKQYGGADDRREGTVIGLPQSF